MCSATSESGATRPGVAFLLAQLGAHAAERFAARLGELDLTPPQVGLLRLIATDPDQSQQAYAKKLGMRPSRFVVFLDELEERGLIERRRSPADRRSHTLHLTADGAEVLASMRSIGRAHEDAVCAALEPEERATLQRLLARMAEQQGLTPQVHPGFRHL